MSDESVDLMQPTLWRRSGWTARVIKNEDDDGWAVEMTRVGDSEPTLVGPWTMGRDKKNPKPLDQGAFNTLVKTASEVLRRHEQHARAQLHKEFAYSRDDGTRLHVALDAVPDEDDPHAVLRCTDAVTGELVWQGRVPANLRLNAANVERLIA